MLTFAKVFVGFLLGILFCSLSFVLFTSSALLVTAPRYTPTRTPQPAPTFTATVEPPTWTPGATWTPEPTQIPVPILIPPQPGERVSWTIPIVVGTFSHKVVRLTELGSHLEGGSILARPLDSQGKFILLQLLVKNIGVDSNGFSGFGLKLKDSNGRIYDYFGDSSLYIENSLLCYPDLQPGFSKTCDFIFEVGADSQIQTLIISDQEVFSDVKDMEVDLRN